MTTAAPSGGSGDLSGKSMVLDDAGNAYVATPYSGQIAITRFTPAGVVDTSFHTTGTYVLSSFDGGSDSPASLYFVKIGTSRYLAVAGKGTNGFAVALLNPDATSPVIWSVPLTGNPAVEGGQANAVYIDRNGDVFAAGKNGTHMVIVKLNNSNGSLASWGDSNTGIVTVGNWPSSTGAVANALIQLPSNYTGTGANDMIAGGWESHTYCGPGGACCTACVWALIALTDANSSGGKDTNLLSSGCCNVNIGTFAQQPMQSINGCTGGCYPSNDTINAFTVVYDGTLKVIPIGSTNYNAGTTQVAVGCIIGTSGALDTSYGPDHLGIRIGSNGVGFAGVLNTNTNSNNLNGTVVVGGTGANGTGDFVVNYFNDVGSWVTGFGNGGVFTTDFGTASATASDSARGVAFNSDFTSSTDPDHTGAIIVGGQTVPSGGSGKIALAEYDVSNKLSIMSVGAPQVEPRQPVGADLTPFAILTPSTASDLLKRKRRLALLSG
jgi:hypothetical protein